ncbi:MAG: DNA-binding protein [Hyphomicrobiales bacterium]|nr:DNA-binding protein [Hyphomicrobiales bacterium]
MSDTELLTTAEYAQLRRCSLRTLDRERANRCGCPYVRLGGRVFYRRNDIESYIETLVRRHDGEKALKP